MLTIEGLRRLNSIVPPHILHLKTDIFFPLVNSYQIVLLSNLNPNL